MTFAAEFGKMDAAMIRKSIAAGSRAGVMKALCRETVGFADFLQLLSPAAGDCLDIMAARAAEITKKHFGRNISIYMPLYLSSECGNDCAYCGFNRKSGLLRRTLTIEEIEKEVNFIAGQGIRSVLLLTGDSPLAAPVSYIASAVSEARKKIPQVSLEVYPMDTKDYLVLVGAGASGLTVYQETYDREAYGAVHGTGPKKDFIYRLETPDRALSAGFRKAGIGALLGLNDWRMEAAHLGGHAAYLMKKYWKAEVSVSFPRLRGSGTGFKPVAPVSDRELVQMMLAVRIYAERAGITLSTREPAAFRDNMLGLGVTHLSAGSKTNPGGYSLFTELSGEGQFEIEDMRGVKETADAVKSRGFYPVFKDWDENFTGATYECKN